MTDPDAKASIFSPQAAGRFVSIAVTRIVLVYFAFSALWVVVTDQLVALVFTDPVQIALASTVKGWFYVAVTAALLAVMISHYLNVLAAKDAELCTTQDEKIRSLQLIETIVDGTPDVIYAKDTAGRYLLFNKAAERASGKRSDEVLGRTDADFLSGDVLTSRQKRDAEVLSSGETQSNEEDLSFYDGERHTILSATGPIRSGDGRIVGVYGIGRDITARKRVEAHQRLAARVFETAAEAIAVTSIDAKIITVNPSFCRITGYTAAEVLGRNPRVLKSGRHDESYYQAMWRTLLDEGEWAGEIWNRRKNGEVYPEWLTLSCVRDGSGAVTNYVAVFADLSEIRRAQEAAEALSWRDPLTGLGNRALFIRQLEQKLASAQREGRFAAVLLLDLDRFKDINEARGLAVGDALLKTIAKQFARALHVDDVLARLDSDEFAVLLPRLYAKRDAAARQALAVAERLRTVLHHQVELGGESFHFDASVGIALFPKATHESAADVLGEADTAMHQAKIDGGRSFFFEAAMGESIKERYHLERELRQGVGDGQLRLYLQPQVDTGGRQVGAEALVRWQHPVRGLVPPGVFIPLAEASDIIVAIDRWMLTEVCRLLAHLDSVGRALRIAVNISPRHFQRADFVDEVKSRLAASGADPSHLILEVTEGLVIGDIADVVAKMTLLTGLGIHFSMDDFGTGYSSLAYLKRLPIHELKIDKSFIQDAPTDSNDAALVETILAVAKHLNLRVVAEGVETQAHADFLNARAAVIHQGYLYGRPEPANIVLDQLLGGGTMTSA